jgi:glycosyltransferase involved in cell wall biosynthesis
MGLYFFPRGGSAHVARALARNLPKAGWGVTLVSGSVDLPGRPGDAREFFGELPVRPVDMTEAALSEDPLAHLRPLHGSFEDRPGAPDRVLAALDDDQFEHQVDAWADALEDAGAAEHDLLHLHHLTPLNEAAERVAPDVPVIGHVHGTELLMLEAIAADPDRWPHGEAWAERMRGWAQRCAQLVLLSEPQRDRVTELLGVDADRCLVLPNGFEPGLFRPGRVDRAAHWRRHLVDEPRGWGPGGEAGSVRYTLEDVERLAREPTILYVGRFTEVKRVGLLVRAHARARAEHGMREGLVLLGGFPGEWEGEHPLDVMRETGTSDVFLAGWHDHDQLPGFLHASDVVVLPSVREQFGQVLVEGMACGLAAIAVDRHGPGEIVDDGVTGWLVEPDDEAGLAAAMAEAAGDVAERRRRGEAAARVAADRYSWPALAARLAEAYDEVAMDRSAGLSGSP